jgi:hypothetical protein
MLCIVNKKSCIGIECTYKSIYFYAIFTVIPTLFPKDRAIFSSLSICTLGQKIILIILIIPDNIYISPFISEDRIIFMIAKQVRTTIIQRCTIFCIYIYVLVPCIVGNGVKLANCSYGGCILSCFDLAVMHTVLRRRDTHLL